MKRFTLTRGSEVLAEGVVWSDGRVSARTPGLVGSGYFDSVAAFEQARLLGGQSIVWIDETHEAKGEPGTEAIAAPPGTEVLRWGGYPSALRLGAQSSDPALPAAPQFDLAKHRELMAEWRERNDGGDCGRVANELVRYIDEVLVPVEGAARIVNLAPPAYEPPRCKVCGTVARDGVIEHSKACYQLSAEGGGEEDVDDAHVSSSYEELRRTVATYCPSLVGFLPPEPAPPNPAPPGATRGGPATTREYVREQVTRGLPKGKLPSERVGELYVKWNTSRIPNRAQPAAMCDDRWSALLDLLDERLGRAP